MGRKKSPAANRVVLTENSQAHRIPLFADGSLTDTDIVQSPSDRFHRWLMNFSSLIQEYRVGELIVWDTDLAELIDKPSDAALQGHVRKASEWTELMYELRLLQSAFTRMLLQDQLRAAELFEVQDVTQLIPNEKNIMVPTVVEILRASFTAPFLASAFEIVWSTIKTRQVVPIAIYELKKVTVHRIPGQWIREDRNGDSTFAVTNLLWNRQDQCDICGELAWLPYESCWFCNASPSYHHGRCCPDKRNQAASSSSRSKPASSSSGGRSAGSSSRRPTAMLGF